MRGPFAAIIKAHCGTYIGAGDGRLQPADMHATRDVSAEARIAHDKAFTA
jgi:hypothetical protein